MKYLQTVADLPEIAQEETLYYVTNTDEVFFIPKPKLKIRTDGQNTDTSIMAIIYYLALTFLKG